jgi:hypothetical protein
MKALSIRAPWWWFILHGGKDIENRDWSTRYRGPLLIQASKWWRAHDVDFDMAFCIRLAPNAPRPTMRSLRRGNAGKIVGRVDLVDCVEQSDSPWFFGPYGFVLANPVAFETPIPFKGALGLFNVPDEVVPR